MTNGYPVAMNHKIAITMPLYNEAQTISGYLMSINSAFKSIGITPFFVVADDCSKDNSLIILNDLSRQLNIMVLPATKNEGSGPATIRALTAAVEQNIEYVVNCDSDGQFDPMDIVAVYQKLCIKSDLETAVQALRTDRKEDWYRGLGTFSASLLASIKARKLIQDSNCPLRGFSKNVLLEMLTRIEPDQITPNMAFSVLCAKNSTLVSFIKVRWLPRTGDTKQGTLWTSRNKLGSMWKYFKFCYRASAQWINWNANSTRK